MHPVLYAIYMILDFYSFIMIAAIVFSLLQQFEVINFRSPLVMQIHTLLRGLTEPVLIRIRKYIPPMGGFDLSPVVVFMAINLLQYTISYYSAKTAISAAVPVIPH